MSATTFLALCASVLMVKTISAQCIGYGNNGIGRAGILGTEIAGTNLVGARNGLSGYGCGISPASIYAAPAIATSSGGGLTVSSASPISPNGVSVVSENAIDGVLSIDGQLPFLAAVALEGSVPSSGAAGVSYSCGNGNVGISGESLAAAGIGAGVSGRSLANNIVGGNLIGAGYGAGLNAGLIGGRSIGRSCSCGI